MREKILSHSTVVETLAPFIVTYWNGTHDSKMPADVDRIFRQAARQVQNENNIVCFVLNATGDVLHSFNAFQGSTPVGPGSLRDRLANYFNQQIQDSVRGLKIPARKVNQKVALPDTTSGVRLFVVSHDQQGQLDRDPIVEVEPMSAAQWKKFSYDAIGEKIDAAVISNWLSHVYPSAQRGVPPLLKVQSVTGSLRWQSGGADKNSRYAILRGNFRMSGEGESEIDRSRQQYMLTGTFEAVFTYGLDSPDVGSVRAVVQGTFPAMDRGTDQQREILAVIESRPE
ncbi:MAG: hypothetical protein VB862_11145 [Pirellulaceae bacterium]